MTALYIGLTLKLVADTYIPLEAGSKEDEIKVPEFFDVVLGVVEEVVVATPWQIVLVHGAEDGAEVHEVHFLVVDQLFLGVEHLVDPEVAGDVDLDHHVAPAEEVEDHEDSLAQLLLAHLVLPLRLVPQVDRQVLRVGVESLEEVESPLLLLLAQERPLLEEVVKGCVGQSNWEGVVAGDVLPLAQQML